MSLRKDEQRRVLLIDHDSIRQHLPAAALRNFEIEVHTASHITDAERLWMARSYNLVLLAARENSEEAVVLCSEFKKSRPQQRIALLVGPPQYVKEIGSSKTNTRSIVVPAGSA